MILLDNTTALVTHDGESTVRRIPTRGEVLDVHNLHGVSDRWDVLELAVRSA